MKITIYKIENTITGWYYIGSTNNYNSRKMQHLNSLKRSNHHCLALQNAYNKYNVEAFIFSIIEQVDEQYRYISEEWYIKQNINKIYNTIIEPIDGVKLTDKQIAKRSISRRKWNVNTLKNLLTYLINNSDSTVKDALLKFSISRNIFTKTILTRITNQDIIDSELEVLIAKYKLNNRKSNSGGKINNISFKSPKGKIIKVTNGLGNFAREYSLDPYALSKVKNKHQIKHKGWTLYEQN